MAKYLIVVWKWDLIWKMDEGRKDRVTSKIFIDYFKNDSTRFDVAVENVSADQSDFKFIGFTKSNSFDNNKSYIEDDIKKECNSILRTDDNQVLLLLHSGDPDKFNENKKNNLLNKFGDNKIKARLFFGGNGKVYEKLIDGSTTYFRKDAINNPLDKENFCIKRENFLSVWDWYWNKLELENIKKDIINLCLPLSIDIQGLSEVDENKRNQYLNEVLAELKKNQNGKSYAKYLNEGWNEIKKILLPESEGKEVLDSKYRLTEEEKKKVKFPIENIDSNSLEEFIKENFKDSNNPNFLPNWLQEVVKILDEKIKQNK